MNAKDFALKALTIVCVYLISTISTASAIEITIYSQIMSGENPATTGESETVTIDYSEVISKDVKIVHESSDVQWKNVKIEISVLGAGSSSHEVKRIYLYSCKQADPIACSGLEPINAENSLTGNQGTFLWSDLARNSNEASFLTLVKLMNIETGKESWIGYWDRIVRSGQKEFDIEEHDVSDIRVFAKPGVREPSWIKEYIETYYMIPFNWVDRVTLGSVNGNTVTNIYSLLADSEDMNTPDFVPAKTPNRNTIEGMSKDFLFSIAEGSFSNPVTFFANSDPECGDTYCDIGENSDNCCKDCKCPGDMECDFSDVYDDGLCHVCGDRIPSPVETYDNCCADVAVSVGVDAACPGDDYCDMSESYLPEGKCVSPKCKNDNCEPSEDSKNCPSDCHDTDGKTCSDVYDDEGGLSYYYDAYEDDCVLPKCEGDLNCESRGGENSNNCCIDCPCDEEKGEYCDTSANEGGSCVAAKCGENPECESPIENQENCCTDCKCPGDLTCDGSTQTCHLCGNNILESPVEDENNCCMDANCPSERYCASSGSCTSNDDIELKARAPETMHCESEAKFEVSLTADPAPEYIESFEKIDYLYDGKLYSLDINEYCNVYDNVYECILPTNDDNTFVGCFGDEGPADVEFHVKVKYREDKLSSGYVFADINDSVSFKVTETKSTDCNFNKKCEPGLGETSSSCCWDCGCASKKICTSRTMVGGCKDESDIKLVIGEGDLPSKDNINCEKPSGNIVIKGHIQNFPDFKDDTFLIHEDSWILEYDGVNYTSSKIKGFECEVVKTVEDGVPNGDVQCSIPMSLFPACPVVPPAQLKLYMNVHGGGLSKFYSQGLEVSSDVFSLDYKHGYPLCTPNNKNCDSGLGENQDTCCMNCGCPDGRVCTLDFDETVTPVEQESGGTKCIPQYKIGLIAIPESYEIDCTVEDAQVTSQKQFVINLNTTHRPYSSDSLGIQLGNVYLNDTNIKTMNGECTPKNPTGHSYEWECKIPVSKFEFCWDKGVYTANLDTDISWVNGDGDTVKNRIEDLPVKFEIVTPMERSCNANRIREPSIGERMNSCCPDFGCTKTDGKRRVCTAIGEDGCVTEDKIKVIVGNSPKQVACKNSAENFRFDVTIENAPYNTKFTEWYIEYDGNRYSSQTSSGSLKCTPYTSMGETVKGKYTCEIPINKFWPCNDDSLKDNAVVELEVGVDIRYLEANSQESYYYNTSTKISTLIPETGNLNCGNSFCDYGENQENCCTDCPCDEAVPGTEGTICTNMGRCVNESQIKMEIIGTKPISVATDCLLVGGLTDTDDSDDDDNEFEFSTYFCNFKEPVELEARVTPMPVNMQPLSNSYIWKENENEDGKLYKRMMNVEPNAIGMTLGIQPDPSGSFSIDSFANEDKKVVNTWLSNISVTVQSVTMTGDVRVTTLEAKEPVRLDITASKDQNLIEQEKVLEKLAKAMKKANAIVCTFVSVLAFCSVCALMAGGAEPEKVKSEVEALKDKRKTDMENFEKGKNIIENWETSGYAYTGSPPEKQYIENIDGERIEVNSKFDVYWKVYRADYKDLTDATAGDKTTNVQPIGQGPFGSMSLAMFSNLMNAVGAGNTGAGLIAGSLAGGVFIAIGLTILKDCTTALAASAGGAIVVCGTLLLAGSGGSLRTITKMCDQLSSALEMLKLVVSVQNTATNYQACMVSAEASLATSSRQSETGYDTAMRTANYYKQLSQCHQQATIDTSRMTNQMNMYSWSMQNSMGWPSSGHSATLSGGDNIMNPGETLTINVGTPSSYPNGGYYPAQSSYYNSMYNQYNSNPYHYSYYGAYSQYQSGTVQIAFSYRYQDATGVIGGAGTGTAREAISTGSSTGYVSQITCQVNPASLDCLPFSVSYQSLDKTIKPCGDDARCSGAWLTGTVQVLYNQQMIATFQYKGVPSGTTPSTTGGVVSAVQGEVKKKLK